MTQSILPRIRYASDMPFAVGMVLADDDGRTVEVTYVGARTMRTTGTPQGCLLYTGSFGGHSEGFVRARFPYLVFVTELVAAAAGMENDLDEAEEEREWQEHQEVLRVGALAQWAQHEDDLKAAILDRAEAERQRKNRPVAFAIPESPKRQLPSIVTWHVYPPIPVRSNDWAAYRDGHEEDGNYGWGPTEADAVADLLALEADAD